jgi:hypothetical protein
LTTTPLGAIKAASANTIPRQSNVVLFLSSDALEDELMSNALDPVDPACFNYRVDGQFP